MAIGELLERGGDPYTQGWGASGRADYIGQISPFWRDTPSTHSPLALRLLQLVAHVTGGDLRVGALLFRALAVVGLIVTGALVVRVAGQVGLDRAGAVWVGVANPVVPFGAATGAHLDALVAPLVLAAVVSVAAGRSLMAGVMLGLATQLKVTSVVVLAVVVAWSVLNQRSRVHVRTAVSTTIATVVTFVGGQSRVRARVGLGGGARGAWAFQLQLHTDRRHLGPGPPGRPRWTGRHGSDLRGAAVARGGGARPGSSPVPGCGHTGRISLAEAAGWSLVAVTVLSSAF